MSVPASERFKRFYTNLFTIPKKDGIHPILNVKTLNTFLEVCKVWMESVHSVGSSELWAKLLAYINIKDSYLQIPYLSVLLVLPLLCSRSPGLPICGASFRAGLCPPSIHRAAGSSPCSPSSAEYFGYGLLEQSSIASGFGVRAPVEPQHHDSNMKKECGLANQFQQVNRVPVSSCGKHKSDCEHGGSHYFFSFGQASKASVSCSPALVMLNGHNQNLH